MTAQMTAARDRYEVARAEIVEIQTRARNEDRDLTAEEAGQVEEHAATATRAATVVEYLTREETNVRGREQERARAVNDLAASIDAGNRGELGGGRMPSLVPGGAQLAEMFRAATDEQGMRRWTVEPSRTAVSLAAADDQHRAVVTTTATGVPMVPGAGSGLREPRRIATAAGMDYQRVNGVEGTVFPVFGSADSADVVIEGLLKPEYDAITSGTVTPQVIALWTEFTRQVGMSLPNFERRLQGKLAARVARREDLLVVTRVLGTPGIQTYAAEAAQPHADSLLAAAAMVLASDVAASPNLAVVHPDDVVAIFGGLATGTAGETPQTAMRLDLHGMTVYPSTAVTPGTALVGAWPAAAEMVVGMPPTVLVDSMSGLKTNKILLLLEEAVNIGVSEPEGFVSVDFVPAA